MSRWRRSWVPVLLLLVPASAGAGVTGLTLLDQVQGDDVFLPDLSQPILADNGAAYWRAKVDYQLGGDRLMGESGALATDARTLVEAGDFPLLGEPSDARGSDVLLGGTYFEPDGGGGYWQTGAIFQFPGLARLVYFGSTFPGFTSDPVGLQVTSRAFYDSDHSVVFLMRRATTFPNFDYAICREVGGAIAVLVQTGVTLVPGGNGQAFTLLQKPVVDGGVILFYGEGAGRRGVYQIVGGVITTVADNQTPLPGEASPPFILASGDVSFSNDGLDVVLALTNLSGGVWKRVSGQWSRVVATNTPIPGGTGNFFYLAEPAIRGGKVVFLGGRDNSFAPPLQAGLYTDAFGPVTPIVDLSTGFAFADPRSFVVADGRWFDGDEVAFAVEGTDWRALYRGVPVPEPGPAVSACAAIAALAAAGRRARPRGSLIPDPRPRSAPSARAGARAARARRARSRTRARLRR